MWYITIPPIKPKKKLMRQQQHIYKVNDYQRPSFSEGGGIVELGPDGCPLDACAESSL
jgi:hypothetical protein